MDVSASATMNDAATCDKRWRAAGPRETSVSGTHHVPAVSLTRRGRLTRPSVVFFPSPPRSPLSGDGTGESFGRIALGGGKPLPVASPQTIRPWPTRLGDPRAGLCGSTTPAVFERRRDRRGRTSGHDGWRGASYFGGATRLALPCCGGLCEWRDSLSGGDFCARAASRRIEGAGAGSHVRPFGRLTDGTGGLGRWGREWEQVLLGA